MKFVVALVLVALALASASDPLPSNSVGSSDNDWVTPEIVSTPANNEEEDMNENEPEVGYSWSSLSFSRSSRYSCTACIIGKVELIVDCGDAASCVIEWNLLPGSFGCGYCY